MRKLSREYGWAAFGVYMALTALDLPFCYLAVRWLGTERIGRYEHNVVEWFKRAVPFQLPEKWKFWERKAEEEVGLVGEGEEGLVEGSLVGYDHGVKEAERENSGDNASKFPPLQEACLWWSFGANDSLRGRVNAMEVSS